MQQHWQHTSLHQAAAFGGLQQHSNVAQHLWTAVSLAAAVHTKLQQSNLAARAAGIEKPKNAEANRLPQLRTAATVLGAADMAVEAGLG
jgi:hypothetical protein